MQVAGLDRGLIEAASRKLHEVVDAEDALWSKLCTFSVSALTKLDNENVLSTELPFFASRYRDELKDRLQALVRNGPSRDSLFWIAFYLYAAITERAYHVATFDDEDARLLASFDEADPQWKPDERVRILYLRSKLPRDLLILESAAIRKDLEERIAKETEQVRRDVDAVANWSSRLDQWDMRVSEIEGLLKQHAEKLNFVGLSRAFGQLISKVKTEKRTQVTLLSVAGVFLVAIPLISPVIFGLGFIPLAEWTHWLPYAIPLVVVELVLLYFFRIFLRNFYSLDAQELQLQLRNSLCAFVQSYAEFASRLRTESDKGVLERFEALIFSGITPDPAAIPSQFDGIEQLAKLVHEFRAGSK